MRALECPLQTRFVIDISCDDVGAQLRQGLGFIRIDVSCQCPYCESAVRVAHDGADQTASLGAGGTDYRNDLLLCHGLFLS